MRRTCSLLGLLVIMIVSGCGNHETTTTPSKKAVNAPQKTTTQTRQQAPKKGEFHYPNFPKTLWTCGGDIPVLHEAKNKAEIDKWAKENYIWREWPLQEGWLVKLQDYGSGKILYRLYLFSYHPLSKTDEKPWKLLSISHFEPIYTRTAPHARGISRIYIDENSRCLIVRNEENKVIHRLDISAEMELVKKRYSKSR